MTKYYCLLMSFFALIFPPSIGEAGLVIRVNVTDPNAVTFETTESFASGNFQSIPFLGITLHSFFSGNTTVMDNSISSTIAPFNSSDGSSRIELDRIFVGSFPGGFTPQDVNFYRDGAPGQIYSFLDQRALTGSAIANLTSMGGLPSIGAFGDVFIGNPDDNFIIGQWQAVPEPTSLLLVATGSLLLLPRRRR